MQTAAIIQARMGSTRLPGKILRRLGDRSVLAHVISRVRACSSIDDVIVATTTSSKDDVVVSEAKDCGANWFRGSEPDVLDRYYHAAKAYRVEIVVRVTSDDPLLDPCVISAMLKRFDQKTRAGHRVDYLSNNLGTRTFPVGLDAEIFTFVSLERAFHEAHHAYEREHVSPYIYRHPELFALYGYENETNLSEFRWTLDTEDDWKLISAIYAALYKNGQMFTMDQVLALIDQRPELRSINAHVRQKETP